MAFNINATNINLLTPSAVTTPSVVGEVTYFFNVNDNNRLYYKDSDGNVFLYTDPQTGESCCACDIIKNMTDAAACALKKGLMTAAEYQTFITSSVTVTSTDSVDPVTGAHTCTVSLNPAS
jgi:hypothetical protein